MEAGEAKDITNANEGLTVATRAESLLLEYIASCAEAVEEHEIGRTVCHICQTSNWVYCTECLRLLIPPNEWPKGLRDLKLPFDLDIVLQDRRKSATGVQVASIFHSIGSKQVQLVDYEQGNSIPNYTKQDGTYLLFPSPTSKSIQQLTTGGAAIRKIVVLDCTWAKTSSRLDPALSNLPHVHLDLQPTQYLFWRWHNNGPGKLSTTEAIYYAACHCLGDNDEARIRQLLPLVWIFGLKRSTIERRHREGKVKFWRRPPQAPFGLEYRQLKVEQTTRVSSEHRRERGHNESLER